MSAPEISPEVERVAVQAASDALAVASRAIAATDLAPEQRITALVLAAAALMAVGLRGSGRPVADLAAARAIYGPAATPRPAEEGD